MLSDGVDLDTYLGLMQKDAALQNAIFHWELIGGLPDVCSGFMKSITQLSQVRSTLSHVYERLYARSWLTFKQKSKEHSGLNDSRCKQYQVGQEKGSSPLIP